MYAWWLIFGLAGAAPGDFDRGNALLQSGDLAAAEEAFRQALADDPENADSASQLGFALMEQQRFDEAVAVLAVTVHAHPDHVPSTWYLGITRFHRGEYRGVVEILQPIAPIMEERADRGASLHGYLATSYYHLLGSRAAGRQARPRGGRPGHRGP